MNEAIDREKLAVALESIRKDIAWFHKDIAEAVGTNQTYWLAIIMWLVVSNLFTESFSIIVSLAIGAVIVFVFFGFHGWNIRRRAYQQLKEGLLEFDTKIDL